MTKMAACPFHPDTTPSMALYPDGHYHCFGCGAHGWTKNLPPRYWSSVYQPSQPNLNGKPLSLSSVKTNEAVQVVWGQAKARVERAFAYIHERKLTEAFSFMTFGYYEERLIIPFMDKDGHVRRLAGRAIGNAFPKYILTGPKDMPFFVPDWNILQDSPVIYVFFGLITAIAGRICGLASVASPFGRSIAAEVFLLIANAFPLQQIVIVPDKGEESDAIRLHKAAIERGCGWRVSYIIPKWPEDVKDLDEARVRYGEEFAVSLL